MAVEGKDQEKQQAALPDVGGGQGDGGLAQGLPLPLPVGVEASRTLVQTSARSGNVLQDRFGRVCDYLRIAVTDRCNLRCIYCMPEAGIRFAPPEKLIRRDEILRVVRVASDLGVRKIRFTGGEPLLRRDIVAIVAGTTEIPGIETVHLTTNGVLLPQLAEALLEAGLHGVNISLDTLDPQRFRMCTRRGGIEKVLAGLEKVLELGFPSIKVNVVALRGFNDNEFHAFAGLTRESSLTVRFIELMPFDANQIWRSGRFVSTRNLMIRFKELYPLCEVKTGSATEHQVFRIPGHTGRIAFIPSYSRSFCSSCTRIRLTADGQLRNCLYSETEYG
ncbi:MAG: GTP 3',8-cyclase MoaA, partial [Thermoanaerobaculia bacterium]